MAVKRAFIDTAGNIRSQLTDEEMSRFLEKAFSGLQVLAQAKVMDELEAERCATEAAEKVVANV
jgi:hypothetical protein